MGIAVWCRAVIRGARGMCELYGVWNFYRDEFFLLLYCLSFIVWCVRKSMYLFCVHARLVYVLRIMSLVT